jgi:hypothetical protein
MAAAMDMTTRRSLLSACGFTCFAAGLRGQEPAPAHKLSLREQFGFESRLWTNLHHFLYVLARSRTQAPDRLRVAVRDAPLDMEGFDALPAAMRADWEAAVAAYLADAAPLDIDHGKLVDVNYAVADLAPRAPIAKAADIPATLRSALEKAEPAYRALWWPRHDAANLAWVRQLRPQIERYGPAIAEKLTAAFQHPLPPAPVRVEVVAYANWAGAYTTFDPDLITISSLNSEHRGAYGMEQLFHECSHLMMETVDAGLQRHAEAFGKPPPRGVSHTILFYTVGEAVRSALPGHVPYAIQFGVWQRGWTQHYELLKLYWQPYLVGRATMDQALDGLLGAFK